LEDAMASRLALLQTIAAEPGTFASLPPSPSTHREAWFFFYKTG
jgi:hypothetical protein